MFLGYRVKKRSMSAYNRVIVPKVGAYRSFAESDASSQAAKNQLLSGAVRMAMSLALVLALVGVIVCMDPGKVKIKTSSVQNAAAQPAAVQDAFTLVAYAASPSSVSNAGSSLLPNMQNADSSTGTVLQPNVSIKLPAGKVEVYKPDHTKWLEYSSGFQFSGTNISTVTLTSQDGTFAADDPSEIRPQMAKELQWYCSQIRGNPQYEKNPSTIPKYQRTADEQKLWDTYWKTGTSVAFPPSGFIAWWYPGKSPIEFVKDISGTIHIAVKFNDGTTQNKTVAIAENGDGDIVATLE